MRQIKLTQEKKLAISIARPAKPPINILGGNARSSSSTLHPVPRLTTPCSRQGKAPILSASHSRAKRVGNLILVALLAYG